MQFKLLKLISTKIIYIVILIQFEAATFEDVLNVMSVKGKGRLWVLQH